LSDLIEIGDFMFTILKIDITL